jgi:predicted AAA+ superfamily ATPase
MSELATNLGIDKNTVERYIDFLEKSFIIFRLPPYFTNKRKELNKANKVYFYDVGIRNAIIGNYNFLENRNDVGELWENFLIIERMKKQAYTKRYGYNHFRKTYNQVEIDWIEESDGKLSAFEFKRGEKKVSVPSSFAEVYPESSFEVINRGNFLEFVI